jgi:hypothetical protein
MSSASAQTRIEMQGTVRQQSPHEHANDRDNSQLNGGAKHQHIAAHDPSRQVRVCSPLYAGHRGKGRESGWESIMNETISNSPQQGGVGQGRQRPVQELTALNIFQGSLQLAQQFLLQTTPMTSQTSGLPTHCFSESFSAAPAAFA